MRSFFSVCASLALVQHAATLDLTNSVLSPLYNSIDSLLKGDGLSEGALGAIGGVLGEDQEFDYLVAGGGTAGNVMGTRLAQAGYKVAIIEAGGFYEISKPLLSTAPGGDIIGTGFNTLDSIPTVDWVFETEPQAGANNRKFHYARGKCLGGSSALNFMIYHRGSTGTYDRWADLVGDDSYRYATYVNSSDTVLILFATDWTTSKRTSRTARRSLLPTQKSDQQTQPSAPSTLPRTSRLHQTAALCRSATASGFQLGQLG